MSVHPAFIDSINQFVRLTEAEASAILPLLTTGEYQKGQHSRNRAKQKTTYTL